VRLCWFSCLVPRQICISHLWWDCQYIVCQWERLERDVRRGRHRYRPKFNLETWVGRLLHYVIRTRLRTFLSMSTLVWLTTNSRGEIDRPYEDQIWVDFCLYDWGRVRSHDVESGKQWLGSGLSDYNAIIGRALPHIFNQIDFKLKLCFQAAQL